MTTRRAFLAAAFGAATARAIPKYFPLVLRTPPMAEWSAQAVILMDRRPYILYGGGCRQARSFAERVVLRSGNTVFMDWK